MARKTVPTRRLLSIFSLLAGAIGLFLSVPLGNAQQPANLFKADAVRDRVSDAERAEIARRLANAFDWAVKQHAAATEVLAWLKPGQTEVVSTLAQGRPVAKHPPYYEGCAGLYQSEAMENLVKKLTATGRRDEVAAYLHFAQSYLNHQQPQYRAVACEFLARFPLEMIDGGLLPTVAQRLADSAPAFDGARFGMGQQATYITRLVNGVSVADVARAALAGATGFQFQDAKTFDIWWQGNKDCHHRLWYWAVRWALLPVVAPAGVAESKTPVVTPRYKVSVETEFPAVVLVLGRDEALKTLLLANNPDAIAAQAGGRYAMADFDPNRNPNLPVWFGPQLHIEPQVVAKFVQEHSLQPRLLEILQQDQPWPEVATRLAKNVLLSKVIEVLKIVATKPDAAAIQQALDNPIPALTFDPVLQTRLTLLLTTLDPQRSEEILLAQFRQNPKQRGLAVELIRTTGLKHWDAIAPAVQDRDVRERILAPLGQLQTPQAARILAGLLANEDLTPKINEWGYETDPARQYIFDAYVKAAALLNGNQAAISEELVNRARWQLSKGMTEQMQQHNQGVPAARAEAVDRLKKFFDEAAARLR